MPDSRFSPDQTTCPTCGGTGPDVCDWDWEAQMYEARCGDEWHDAQGAPLASDEKEADR